MRRVVIGSILIGMLVLSACSFLGTKEQESGEESTVVSDESVQESTAAIEDDDLFEAGMPIHSGIWNAADYGVTKYYYEFGDNYDGRRMNPGVGMVEAFTYEVTSGDNLVIHYEDRDENAHFSFGDDGKHLVLTYQDYQQSLSWMSHGTLEDIGGLGLTFTVLDITPFGCTLEYAQNGGYVTGEITADNLFGIMKVHSEEEGLWGCSDYCGAEDETFVIDKDSSGSITIDWSGKLGMLTPGDYILQLRIRDIRNIGGDWDSFDYKVWFTVPENDGESLIEKAVSWAGADPSEARYSLVYDFDNDGSLEAFVFIGDEPDEMYSTCAGKVWYVDGDKCEMIKECDNFFVHGDKVIDMYPVGNTVVITLEEAYATETVSYLFTLKGGEWKESNISGIGHFFKPDYVSDYSLSVGEYDYCVDYEEGKEDEALYTGHTWKNYYFYYDEKIEDFREYIGKDISEEDLRAACGYNLAGEIRDEGYEVDNIIQRDNGIINVNYSKTAKGENKDISVEYHNATFNINNQKYAVPWDAKENDWENSDFGGTYLKAITE